MGPDVTGCPKDDNRLIDEENKKQDKKKYKWGEKEVTVKDKKDDKKTSDFDSYIKDRFAFDHNQLMNKQKKDKEAEKNQMDKKREDLEKQKQKWLDQMSRYNKEDKKDNEGQKEGKDKKDEEDKKQ